MPSTIARSRRALATKCLNTWDAKFPSGTSKAGKRKEGRPLSLIAEALETPPPHRSSPTPTDISPMSSTETLVDSATDTTTFDAAKLLKRAQIATQLEDIAAAVPKPKARRQATLVPLHVAQARADIKYRPEGFELAEGITAPRLPKREASTAAVWWKTF